MGHGTMNNSYYKYNSKLRYNKTMENNQCEDCIGLCAVCDYINEKAN